MEFSDNEIGALKEIIDGIVLKPVKMSDYHYTSPIGFDSAKRDYDKKMRAIEKSLISKKRIFENIYGKLDSEGAKNGDK